MPDGGWAAGETGEPSLAPPLSPPPSPDDCRKTMQRGCVIVSSGTEPAASARMRGGGPQGVVWSGWETG